MSKVRIWHASRDAYHACFRLLRLFQAKAGLPIEIERIRVLDMLLLYPSLLHRTTMPMPIKTSFRDLGIPRPEQIFVQLPSNASIFQELRMYQNLAMSHFGARGMLDREELKRGFLGLVESALPQDLLERVIERNRQDKPLVNFLVGPFSEIPLRGTGSLYQNAKLPRRSVAS